MSLIGAGKLSAFVIVCGVAFCEEIFPHIMHFHGGPCEQHHLPSHFIEHHSEQEATETLYGVQRCWQGGAGWLLHEGHGRKW